MVIFSMIAAFCPPAMAGSVTEGGITASQVRQKVDLIVKENMERLHIPGSVVVVTSGEQILFSKGYGLADIQRNTAMDPAKTIVRIGSITKSVTAAAAMQMVERGKLELKKDVNEYLTDFQIPEFRQQAITVHHLLTHTAGLDEAVYGVNSRSPEGANSTGKYLKNYFRTQPPVRPPGTQYDYSNAGVGLVGYLVEQLSGMTLDDYMRQEVFSPLEMPSAQLHVQEQHAEMSKSYRYSSGKFEQLPYTYLKLPGAGDLSVVPNEFAHFMMMLLNEGQYQGRSILNPETVQEMEQKQFAEHPLVDGLGYGLYRGKLDNGIFNLSHTGVVEGFSAEMTLIPSHKIGVFVVSNAAEGDFQLHDEVVKAIGNMLPGKAIKQERGEASSIDLRQYAGEYLFAKAPQHGWGKWLWMLGRTFTVQAAGENLVITGVFPDGNGITKSKTYIPIAENLFQQKDGKERIWLHTSEEGEKLTVVGEITMNKVTSFWVKPAIGFSMYLGTAIFWLLILFIEIVRYGISLFKMKWRPKSGSILLMSALFVVFVAIHLLYSTSAITYGYPAWYAWGICSLPIAAAAVSIYVLIKNAFSAVQANLGSISRCCVALIGLGFTLFLFHWDLLSIH